MRVIFLLLCFNLFYSITFQDIFPLKRDITVENLHGSVINNVDIPLRIDTELLISEGKLIDCSYLRFQAGGDFLEYFVESSCDTDHTLIWINVDTLEVADLTVTMYYDYHDYDRIEDTGPEIEWSSEFLVLTDVDCDDWDDYPAATPRFLQISDTYGEADGSSEIYEHVHRVNGTSEDVVSGLDCGNGCTGAGGDSPRIVHTHSFDYLTTEGIGMPPYQSIKMCSNRYNDLRTNFVLAYNDTDFSPGGMSEYATLTSSKSFVVIYDDDSLSGGVETHHHAVLDENFANTGAEFLYNTELPIGDPSPIPYYSTDSHTHAGVNMNFSEISNAPTSFEIPFAILSEDELDLHPYLFFAKSLPPLGFIQSSLTGRYVRGGSDFGNFHEAESDHELADSSVEIGVDERWSCSMNPEPGIKCAVTMHTHGIDSDLYTFAIDGGDTWDPDDKNRVEVVGALRKPIFTSATVGSEEINIQCGGLEFTDELVCSQHGECVAAGLCVCNTSYFGEICEVWFCGELANTNEDVCSRKGNCTADQTCECGEGYNGTWCEWTCDGIYYNDYEQHQKLCSGHGHCVDIDTCNCTVGNYTGQYCSEWYCFELLNSDEGNVCSGHGDCTDYNYCDCDDGFVGIICQGKLGNAYFSDDGTTLTLEYVSHVKYFSNHEIPDDTNIKKYFPCESKIDNYEILGEDAFCYFSLDESMGETTALNILLGKNPTIDGDSDLYVLDSGDKPNLVSVVLPVHPSLPSVSLRDDVWYCVTNETLLGSCSGNVRDLEFFWTVSLYPDGDIYLTSTEKYFRMEEYGDMERNAEYVVYLQAMNFLGGYDVDYLICYVPPEHLKKSSVFEEGSTYGYVTFFGFFAGGILCLILSCFVGLFCCCWNGLQLDIIQDRLFGIQLLIEDIGIARKKQKLREYRMTMMEVGGGMEEDEWDEYESELKDFARRSVNMSTPLTPSSTTGLLNNAVRSDQPTSPINPPKDLKEEAENEFNVINDVEVDENKEEEDDLSNALTFRGDNSRTTPQKSKSSTPVKNITPEKVKERSLSELDAGVTSPPKKKLPSSPPPKSPPPKKLPKSPPPKQPSPLPKKKPAPQKKKNIFDMDSDEDSDEERKSHHTFQSFVNQFKEED